jgi:fructose-1,6-bisphosphatase II / sedoheptulose-1,7-bisphosphatase
MTVPVATSAYLQADIAVDALEATSLGATGATNAIAVLAASTQLGLLNAPDLYSEEPLVGPGPKAYVSLDAPVCGPRNARRTGAGLCRMQLAWHGARLVSRLRSPVNTEGAGGTDATGAQGASRAHTGSMQATSNAAPRDAAPAECNRTSAARH